MEGLPDLIISLMTLLLNVSLLPTILGKNKPEHSTAIFSAGALAVIGITFFTLGMSFSAYASLVGAVGWTVLAVQTRK